MHWQAWLQLNFKRTSEEAMTCQGLANFFGRFFIGGNMKEIRFVCDHCGGEKRAEQDPSDWIVFGSDNNSLYMRAPSRTLDKYRDIHFCSKVCFVEFVFNVESDKTLSEMFQDLMGHE